MINENLFLKKKKEREVNRQKSKREKVKPSMFWMYTNQQTTSSNRTFLPSSSALDLNNPRPLEFEHLETLSSWDLRQSNDAQTPSSTFTQYATNSLQIPSEGTFKKRVPEDSNHLPHRLASNEVIAMNSTSYRDTKWVEIDGEMMEVDGDMAFTPSPASPPIAISPLNVVSVDMVPSSTDHLKMERDKT